MGGKERNDWEKEIYCDSVLCYFETKTKEDFQVKENCEGAFVETAKSRDLSYLFYSVNN